MPPSSRISLDDVLSSQSSEPYPYDALLDFLSRGHCFDTLCFISESKSYRDTYSVYSTSVDNCNILRDTALVTRQWKCLMATYVFPESPSQINFPDYIRNQLLVPGDTTLYPPSPQRLDSAIDYAYEIVTEDALVPFTRSFHMADKYAVRLGYSPHPSLQHSNNSQILSRELGSPKIGGMYDNPNNQSIQTLSNSNF